MAQQIVSDDTPHNQTHAYTKAVKSIQGTLENPQEYYETFVIQQITKIGDCYNAINDEMRKWGRLKNNFRVRQKNAELSQYVSALQKCKMYQTLSKLLSPTVGRTKAIQTASCKTLSIIAFRPNAWRDADWSSQKQTFIALSELEIDGSMYNTLLLISHIFVDNALSYENLRLKCYALRLLANVVNHNSDVTVGINKKQFRFISIILTLLRNEQLFELTLKCDNKSSKQKKPTLNHVAVLAFINGLSAILNLIQHNEANRIEFCELNGWELICCVLTHKCLELRQLGLCFINTTCISSKLCSKYFLNTKYNATESFKILLNMIEAICTLIKKDIGDIDANNTKRKALDRHKYKNIDTLLCKLVCAICSCCCENMIGWRKFAVYKSWIMIRKLLNSMNNLSKYSTYSVSNTLHLQLFALLSCFNVSSKEKWKLLQYDVMFKNAPKDNTENMKKLTMKQRKAKQKADEAKEREEYQNTQRIIKHIKKMLGGFEDTIKSNDNSNRNSTENKEYETDDDSDRDIVLKYLVINISKPRLVVGALCAISSLCRKMKYDGNITKLEEIIENMRVNDDIQYNASLQGLRDRLSSEKDDGFKAFKSCTFSTKKEFNEFVYFVSALNDIFDLIVVNPDESDKTLGKEMRKFLFGSNLVYVLCMGITQPTHNYFTKNTDEYKAMYDDVNDLKMNICYGLAKLIKFDTDLQKRFSLWIPRVHAALKELATHFVDNTSSQVALAHVIASACFNNEQNIKQLKSCDIEHMLFQLYKETKRIATIEMYK